MAAGSLLLHLFCYRTDLVLLTMSSTPLLSESFRNTARNVSAHVLTEWVLLCPTALHSLYASGCLQAQDVKLNKAFLPMPSINSGDGALELK